jgi:hypothetical protein
MSTLMSALEGRLCTWTECSALCVAGFVTGSSSGSLWDNGIGHNNLQWQDGYPHNKQGKTLTDCCSMSSSRVAAADCHLKYIPFLHCPYQNLGQKSCNIWKYTLVSLYSVQVICIVVQLFVFWITSSSLKFSESKNCWFRFFEKKIRIRYPLVPVFHKHQRTGSFYEKLAKNWWLERWVFWNCQRFWEPRFYTKTSF